MFAVLSSVCATTVDNSGVFVYYLKGTSVCCRCQARTVGFSGTRLHLCISIEEYPYKTSSSSKHRMYV